MRASSLRPAAMMNEGYRVCVSRGMRRERSACLASEERACSSRTAVRQGCWPTSSC